MTGNKVEKLGDLVNSLKNKAEYKIINNPNNGKKLLKKLFSFFLFKYRIAIIPPNNNSQILEKKLKKANDSFVWKIKIIIRKDNNVIKKNISNKYFLKSLKIVNKVNGKNR